MWTTKRKPTQTHAPVFVRWFIKQDIEEVMRIERESYHWPWTRDEILCFLCGTKHAGMVAELDGKVVGFMLYALHSDHIALRDIAVCGWNQRKGVGRRLVQALQAKMHEDRRSRISLRIAERNLDGQQFFKSMGFKAFHVIHDYFTHPPEDAYLMRCELADCEGR
jgi:ribosomal-protein-alanine N-acetyltransferase